VWYGDQEIIYSSTLNKKLIPALLLYPAFTILVMVTAGYPFFWDTVQLASRHADFFYNSDFKSIILPQEIDSGHIPTLGIYLAVVWKFFGRTLFVSHVAMLPFVIGIVYQAIKLINKYIPEKWRFPAVIIFLINPVLLAQCTLVSPDVFLVFFFLMAMNNITFKNRTWYALAIAGLTLSSMRGMMCAAGLFLADLIIRLYEKEKDTDARKLPGTILKTLVPYLPGLIIAGAFLLWHFYRTGWIGYHTEMPWYQSFERVDLKGALFNTLILGWRLVDFGNLFIWIAALYSGLHFYRHRQPLTSSSGTLCLITIGVFLSIAHAFILHKNLSMHRYLLPVYMSFSLLILYYIYSNTDIRFPRKFFTWMLIAGLLTGNFWVYPDRIAKGWDSTLAYLPYFPLRKKMMDFMNENGIRPEETGTGFSNTAVIDQLELNGNTSSFAIIDLSANNYVFYSNIYNFSDEILQELKENWQIVKEFRAIQVKVILYKNSVKNTLK